MDELLLPIQSFRTCRRSRLNVPMRCDVLSWATKSDASSVGRIVSHRSQRVVDSGNRIADFQFLLLKLSLDVDNAVVDCVRHRLLQTFAMPDEFAALDLDPPLTPILARGRCVLCRQPCRL